MVPAERAFITTSVWKSPEGERKEGRLSLQDGEGGNERERERSRRVKSFDLGLPCEDAR